MLAGARPEIDHVVGRPDRLFVVLDDDDGVAEVAQPRQRREQAPVVALVQADRRLVEHVQHAGEVGADLRRQPDALPFAARQRGGAAAQRQIADAHVVEKPQPLLNLSEHPPGDERLALGQLELLEHRQRLGDRQLDVLGDRPALDAHREALGLQALAGARRAGAQRAVRLELLLLGPGALLVPPAQVRDQPLELAAERLAGRRPPARGPGRPAPAPGRSGPEEQHSRTRRASDANGTVRSMPKSGPAPAAPRAPACCRRAPRARWRRRRATSTRRARRGPDRSRTTAPRPWQSGHAPCGELNENARGVISGMLSPQSTHASRRENSRSPVSRRVDDDDVVGQAERRLDRLGQPPLDAASHDQPIDDDVDRVVAAAVELDVLVERAELAVDARLGEPARAQRRELLLELALPAPDDRARAR